MHVQRILVRAVTGGSGRVRPDRLALLLSALGVVAATAGHVLLARPEPIALLAVVAAVQAPGRRLAGTAEMTADPLRHDTSSRGWNRSEGARNMPLKKRRAARN